jgi:ABC-2 type transport system permease protein
VSFLVVGVLVATLVLPIQQNVQTRLSPWTLETILMTGIRTPTFVLGTVAWTYLLSVILFIPQLLIGIYVFQAHLIVNYVSFVLALFISSAIIFALAIINTGFRIVTKSNDPITWSLNVAAQLLAGMTFPVQHLDDYLPGLSTISWVLPQTWIYHILRLATLTGASVLDPGVATSYLVASLFAATLLPISFRVYRWGLKRAKREGTLGWY